MYGSGSGSCSCSCRCLSIYLSVCLSIYLSICNLQAWKRSYSARLPEFLGLTTSKTQQFCDLGFWPLTPGPQARARRPVGPARGPVCGLQLCAAKRCPCAVWLCFCCCKALARWLETCAPWSFLPSALTADWNEMTASYHWYEYVDWSGRWTGQINK